MASSEDRLSETPNVAELWPERGTVGNLLFNISRSLHLWCYINGYFFSRLISWLKSAKLVLVLLMYIRSTYVRVRTVYGRCT